MSEQDERQVRNEIFAREPGPPSADEPLTAPPPGIQVTNVMKDDFGFEIPVESVPLPSRGVVYPVDSPLHNRETIDIKAMTAREEDILTSRALIKKGTVITKLIQSCLTDRDIRVEDMLVGDRNALMVALRVTGYGTEYKAEVDCPSCNERSKQSFNLGELPIKRLEIQPVAQGINQFEFRLPVTKKRVRFKFMTGFEERDMMVATERKRKSGMEADNQVTGRLENAIVSIDQVTERSKISAFVRSMPARDSLELRKHIEKHEPGIDMKSWMDCPHCFDQAEVRLPLGAGFFWPDVE